MRTLQLQHFQSEKENESTSWGVEHSNQNSLGSPCNHGLNETNSTNSESGVGGSPAQQAVVWSFLQLQMKWSPLKFVQLLSESSEHRAHTDVNLRGSETRTQTRMRSPAPTSCCCYGDQRIFIGPLGPLAVCTHVPGLIKKKKRFKQGRWVLVCGFVFS